jgi:hypothetical protein
MVRAGLSAGIILTTIEMAPAVGVDVSAAALIDLKTAGVDDRIIEAMQTTAGTVPMEPAQPPCAAPEPSDQPAASRDPDLILRNFSTLRSTRRRRCSSGRIR